MEVARENQVFENRTAASAEFEITLLKFDATPGPAIQIMIAAAQIQVSVFEGAFISPS